jgi:hypothetical protein
MPIDEFPHRWIWPVRPPIDEVKRATAVEKYWSMGLLSDPEVLEEVGGIDIDTHRENMARTYEWRREIGAPLPGGEKVESPSANSQPMPDDDKSDETESEDSEEAEEEEEASSS